MTSILNVLDRLGTAFWALVAVAVVPLAAVGLMISAT